MLNENEQKEEFSFAYIQAIAATAGYQVERPQRDKQSVDLKIVAYSAQGWPPDLEILIQVKCTASQTALGDKEVKFVLKANNYNDLRKDGILPRILIVVLVPQNMADWVEPSEQQLILRHCAYWIDLRGRVEIKNTESITIHIPRKNQFTVQSLQEIVARFQQEMQG
ncbi:MAG: DUF4365 domain-containing protein [Acidobacteria bacterium]|nr:DUF4365 domain-containing protein [Acidobacteriota bacterium]